MDAMQEARRTARAPETSALHSELGEFPWLHQLVRHRGWQGVDLCIAEADEMLEFSWRDGGDLDTAVLEYFCSGERVAGTVLELCDQWFAAGDEETTWRLLDFGGGYGRVTRFFAHQLGPERVTSSDLLAGALRFVERQLGVATLPSAHSPEQLAPSGRYDVIYVGSLFTHLPDTTFSAWMSQLLDRLSPGGLLLFTVHGEQLMPPELDMPGSGFRFVAASESHDLDHAQYGSTWITEPALRRRVEAQGAALRLWPRGLCGYQDLVAACPRGDAERLTSLRLDPGARVHVERCELRSGSRRGRDVASLVLDVSGWAIPGAALAPEVSSLEFFLATEDHLDLQLLATTKPGAVRPELEEPLQLAADTCSGWRVEVPLPTPLRRSRALILLEAVTGDASPGKHERTVRTVSYVGGLERLLYATAHENFVRHRQRVYELAEIIEGMKTSWFWRFRSVWFRIKRALRMTDEDPAGPPITATDRRPPQRRQRDGRLESKHE